tara:strand:- start:496 stop:915 length:420 start_codon:yes stop_codon:yes gene_type:complete
MEKFKYGPLIWNCINEDDESGNFYWNGDPPVKYDDMNIPVDENGLQCLPVESPVHPSWTANNVQKEKNDFLGFDIPSIKSTREWFNENFLIVTDRQCKKYIIRWIKLHRSGEPGFFSMVKDASSLTDMMDRIWPQDEHK